MIRLTSPVMTLFGERDLNLAWRAIIDGIVSSTSNLTPATSIFKFLDEVVWQCIVVIEAVTSMLDMVLIKGLIEGDVILVHCCVHGVASLTEEGVVQLLVR